MISAIQQVHWNSHSMPSKHSSSRKIDCLGKNGGDKRRKRICSFYLLASKTTISVAASYSTTAEVISELKSLSAIKSQVGVHCILHV